MGALTIRLLTCDGTHAGEVCDAEYGGDTDVPSHDVLRDRAAEAGWRHDATQDTDHCPATDHDPTNPDGNGGAQ